MPGSGKAQQFHVRVWRGLWWNSLEHFSLENKLTGHVLEGFIVGIMEKKPFNLHYRITCDSKWQTRQAEITTTHGQERKQLSLVVDQKYRWLQDDHELARVRGARDIDINMTPSTNMLPIKRLHLGPGKSGEITTAWVQFPKMTITPGQQTYTSLGHRTYQYKSSRFKTEIKLDQHGIVENYPPYWKMEA